MEGDGLPRQWEHLSENEWVLAWELVSVVLAWVIASAPSVSLEGNVSSLWGKESDRGVCCCRPRPRSL